MEEQIPLHDAAVVGDVVTIRRLVAEGADVNAKREGERTSALHVAAENGHVAVSRLLVELGADKEASTAHGLRPLHTAAYNNQAEVVKTLVELGADMGALTGHGATPLQLSLRIGHKQVVKVLRELERSAKTEKEAAAKKSAQQAIEQADRMAALLVEEEQRGEAQTEVRETALLAPPSGCMAPGWMVCPVAHSAEAHHDALGGGVALAPHRIRRQCRPSLLWPRRRSPSRRSPLLAAAAAPQH
jgi:hypothetical protein